MAENNVKNVEHTFRAVTIRHHYILDCKKSAPLLAQQLRRINLNNPVEHQISVAAKAAEESLNRVAEYAYEDMAEFCFAPLSSKTVTHHTKK